MILAGPKRLFTLSLLLLLTSCATSAPYAAPSRSMSESNANPSQNRLVSYNARMELVVENVASLDVQVNELAMQLKGYVITSNVDEDRYYAVLRVPAAQLKTALDRLASLGEEKNRNISSTDVTDQVIDTEAELKNLISLRERLRDLLKRAKNVDEVLKVETELTRVQTRIDALNTRLKGLQGQIQYSEITLAAREKRVYGPLGYLFIGVGWVFEKLFVIK